MSGINAFVRAQGAAHIAKEERHPEDYYATDPAAVEALLEVESFNSDIWECASGGNHIADVLRSHGYNVRTSDIVARTETTEQLDFIAPFEVWQWSGDIVTNPPFRFALKFIQRALNSVPTGNKVAMLLKLNFLEGGVRREFFRQAPPPERFTFFPVGSLARGVAISLLKTEGVLPTHGLFGKKASVEIRL